MRGITETGVTSRPRIWRRPRAACVIGGLVLGLSYGPSVTAAAGDTWEGTWERTELPGKHLVLTQTGSMVNGHYDWNDASGVLAGTVSGATLTASFTETHYEGSATLTLAGKTFSGTYTGKNKDTLGPIEGNFDGTCIAGACLSNGAAPSPSPSTVTPISTPPALGSTTLYEAPAAGADQSYPLPKIAKKTRNLEGKLGFVDNQGNPVAGPDVAAIEAQSLRAGEVCFLLALAPSQYEKDEAFKAFGLELPSLVTCIDTVARVLARADEIKRAKGARVSAAARTCAVLVRGKGRAHSPLRMSCKPTATGVSITIRPRSPNQTLAAALHGHAPKLIVGRSAVTPRPAGLRVRELWRAK
jgi:hypothetical protein